MEIGSKIKELRLENGLTQEELANRVELSKGYISQLENNLTSPSIESLMDILEILGTNISDFFSTQDEKVHFQSSEFFEKVNPTLNHKISWIVPNALKYEMEPIIIEINPGGQSMNDNPHPGEEFGYVLEGEVVLVLGNKKHKIIKGETFYYYTNKEHYLINNSKEVAKVLWVSTPPQF